LVEGQSVWHKFANSGSEGIVIPEGYV